MSKINKNRYNITYELIEDFTIKQANININCHNGQKTCYVHFKSFQRSSLSYLYGLTLYLFHNYSLAIWQ